MILLAESGSTSTDWRVIHRDGKVTELRTIGINPAQRTEAEIFSEISNNVKPKLDATIERIYYYGTGVATDEIVAMMIRILHDIFPTATTVEVYSDLLASARALCLHEAGIACILGTGSNSCLYDGTKIVDNVSAGGYILGDEGSGSAIGRKLLNAFLKRGLPEDIHNKLKEEYSLTPAEIIQQVYRQGHNSRYLATFTKFVNQHIDNPAMRNIVSSCLGEFFDNNVMRYPDYKKYKVGFVGSIAHHFYPILKEEADKRGITIGKIIQEPIYELVKYYQDELLAK